MSKAKITIVSYEEFTDIDFLAPATYFNRNALGSYVFYHTRSREVAQEWCDEIHDKGVYKVNAAKISKSNGNNTCTGTSTRRK